jgi:cytoskeletal protein RodZ
MKMSIEHYKEIGDYLRDCRESKGDDITKVSKQLNIRKKYLQAIEDGDFDVLPGSIYTEGYLKNYAEYLELDSQDVLNKYKYGTANDDEEQVEEEFALPEHSGDKFSPNPKLLVGLLIASIALYSIWYQYVNYVPPVEIGIIEEKTDNTLTEDELTILGVITGRVGVDEVENKDALIGMDADSSYSLSVGKPDSNQPQDLSILKKAVRAKKKAAQEEEVLGWKVVMPKPEEE